MTDETITTDQADSRLRAEYFEAVASFAEDAENEVKNGNITDEDDYREYIEQSVDGSSWVIYTANALQVLRYCGNHDAYTDEFGEVPMQGSEINWSALAYAAMLEDVRERVTDFDDLQPEEDDEEAEGETEESE